MWFQTALPAKLKVFVNGGPRIYNNAREAADDLQKRGFSMDQNEPGHAPEPSITVGEGRGQVSMSTPPGADTRETVCFPTLTPEDLNPTPLIVLFLPQPHQVN